MPSQASDNVVWSIIRRSNCKVRAHASFNVRPFFTREKNNLIQRQVYKYCGFREKVVGITKTRTKHKSNSNFGVVVSRKNHANKPQKSKTIVRVDLPNLPVPRTKRAIRRLTKGKMYRPELAKIAVKRVMQVRKSAIKARRAAAKYQKRRIRINKKRGRYARRKYTKTHEKKEGTEEKKNPIKRWN